MGKTFGQMCKATKRPDFIAPEGETPFVYRLLPETTLMHPERAGEIVAFEEDYRAEITFL